MFFASKLLALSASLHVRNVKAQWITLEPCYKNLPYNVCLCLCLIPDVLCVAANRITSVYINFLTYNIIEK